MDVMQDAKTASRLGLVDSVYPLTEMKRLEANVAPFVPRGFYLPLLPVVSAMRPFRLHALDAFNGTHDRDVT